MTETGTAAVPLDSTRLVQAWIESFAQVLSQIGGSPRDVTAMMESPAGLAPASSQDFWIIGVCSGGLRGELSLRVPSASAPYLARLLAGSDSVTDTTTESEQRDAVLELTRQVAGLVATMLKPHWGELQLHLEAAAGAPTWPASSTAWFLLDEVETRAILEMHVSAALAATMRTEASSVFESPVNRTEPLSPTSATEKAKLGLLMDVELAVTLRFGSRKLPLREILDLSPGSVIELDRQVREPVDMLLDGRLVARGEVVVIDGNYGLRITEVASTANI